MEPIDLLSLTPMIIIAMALLMIAFTLFQVFKLIKIQQQISVLTHTHQVIKEDLPWREKILLILRRVQGQEIARLDKDLDKDNQQDFFDKLIEVLDYCESISRGIRHGIYDEEAIRDAYAKLFVLLFAHVERLIHELRYKSNNPETYGAFSAIVKKWQHDSKLERMP